MARPETTSTSSFHNFSGLSVNFIEFYFSRDISVSLISDSKLAILERE